MSQFRSLEIAGVPVILRPPSNPNKPAPLIILWHGFGPPNTEEMLAEILPLERVRAWKAYLGLPLFNKRLPEGGINEIMSRQLDDYVLKLLLSVVDRAINELPIVVKELQKLYNIDRDKGIGLFGFSAGGLAALLALLESNISISAVVLAGVTKNLVAAVETYDSLVQKTYSSLKQQYPWVKEKYHWSSESEAAKKRLDFVDRAAEIATKNPSSAILFLHGIKDEIFRLEDAEKLYSELSRQYKKLNLSQQISMQTFANLGHQINPADSDLAVLQETVANWYSKHF